MKRIVSIAMLALLSINVWMLVFNIEQVKSSGTIFIKSDGSIVPEDAPIITFDNHTFIFTDDINDSIVVENAYIDLDGDGHTLAGDGGGVGIELPVNGVLIKHMEIRGFMTGVRIYRDSNTRITGNNITANGVGIDMFYAQNNVIDSNNIYSNNIGLSQTTYSSYNQIHSNNFEANNYGVYILDSRGNEFYHNNFINNTDQVYVSPGRINIWDDGYPSGGNYWSDYEERYPNATELDGSGIWNTTYTIDEDNQDNYPLVNSWKILRDVAILNVVPSKTIIAQGFDLQINVTVENQGDFIETFNVTVKANTTVIAEKKVRNLAEGNTIDMNFTWGTTTSTPEGNYNLTAIADIVGGEIDVADNILTYGIITVRSPIHDIAVINVSPPFNKTVVCQAMTVNFTATFENQGDFAETFNATFYCNGTVISLPNGENYITITLPASEFYVFMFCWNTTGLAKGHYNISAYAWPVPEETNLANNENFTDSCIMVTMLGDLTGGTANPWDFVPDGIVDGEDLIVVNRCFGSWPEATSPLIWHPNCDITNNDIIDGDDLIRVSRQYGQVDP